MAMGIVSDKDFNLEQSKLNNPSCEKSETKVPSVSIHTTVVNTRS
jgi:hypothetical protein